MPERWSGNELARCICRHQHSDNGGRRSQRFRIKRKKRQDDGQSKYINKDDQEYRKQRRFFHEGSESLLFVFFISPATDNVESTRPSPRSASAIARSLKSGVNVIQYGT